MPTKPTRTTRMSAVHQAFKDSIAHMCSADGAPGFPIFSMAMRTAPSTPGAHTTQVVQATQTITPTGTWRHPRMDEINRRQHAATFSDENIRTILWNTLVLILTFISTAILPESSGH